MPLSNVKNVYLSPCLAPGLVTSRPDLENGLLLLRLERLCRVKVVRPPGLRLEPAPSPSPASRGPDITAATGHWCWPPVTATQSLLRPPPPPPPRPSLSPPSPCITGACAHCVTVQELLQVLGAGAGARCGPHCVRTRTRPLLPPAQETLASAAPRRWRLLLSAANSGNCPRPLYISTSHFKYLISILSNV